MRVYSRRAMIRSVSGTGDTTAPASSYQPSMKVHDAPLLPALIIVWSAREPHRIGEVAFLDAGDDSWTLGRDTDEEMSPRRVRFVRQRPDTIREAGPLEGKALSRRQLHIERRPA